MKLHYLAFSIMMVSVLVSLPSYASSGTVILAKGVVTATSVGSSSRVLAKGGDGNSDSEEQEDEVKMDENQRQ